MAQECCFLRLFIAGPSVQVSEGMSKKYVLDVVLYGEVAPPANKTVFGSILMTQCDPNGKGKSGPSFP